MATTSSRQHNDRIIESIPTDDIPAPRALAVVDAPSASVTPMQQGFLRPLDTAESARAAIKAYEELKHAIIQPSDLQKIGGKNHIKKSGWLRIARAFGLTVEPVSEVYETAADGSWGYAIVVRAVAPNGASMQGDGMCWSSEKPTAQRTRHNVRAHAYTRATNRAISNLVGGGEVSAEEMTGGDEETATTTAAAPDLITVALTKPAILQLLNKLGLRERERQRDKLVEVKATLEGMQKTFNGENVTAELQRQIRVSEAAAAPSLEGVDMGAPGN